MADSIFALAIIFMAVVQAVLAVIFKLGVISWSVAWLLVPCYIIVALGVIAIFSTKRGSGETPRTPYR